MAKVQRRRPITAEFADAQRKAKQAHTRGESLAAQERLRTALRDAFWKLMDVEVALKAADEAVAKVECEREPAEQDAALFPVMTRPEVAVPMKAIGRDLTILLDAIQRLDDQAAARASILIGLGAARGDESSLTERELLHRGHSIDEIADPDGVMSAVELADSADRARVRRTKATAIRDHERARAKWQSHRARITGADPVNTMLRRVCDDGIACTEADLATLRRRHR